MCLAALLTPLPAELRASHHLFSQWEGVVSLHSHGQDTLVPIDDGVGHGCDGRVPNLQTDAGNITNTLQRDTLVFLWSEK